MHKKEDLRREIDDAISRAERGERRKLDADTVPEREALPDAEGEDDADGEG